VLRGAVLGGASKHLIQPFKNAVLSRNLDQNIPKNAIFEKKNAVKSPQHRGLRLQTPALLLSPIAIAFVQCVSSIERTLLLRKIREVTHSKCFGFVFSALSCLFFISNSTVFIGRGANIFFDPGRLVP